MDWRTTVAAATVGAGVALLLNKTLGSPHPFTEHTESDQGIDERKRESQDLLHLLYCVGGDSARKEGVKHRQIACNRCGVC